MVGCSVNVKPVYNDKEQAKAERAVVELHKLQNERKFEDIYARLDKTSRGTTTRDQFMAAANQTFETWGKLQSTSLTQAKVFPTSPIQVKMLYNSKFEKGDAQEWFTWNINGDDVRLFEYRTSPGWDK
jgi:multidrug efflux pump subunit AcrA (membrane-fusion protein)